MFYDTTTSLGVAGLFGIPFAITIAITRYRLYDIDRVISRTVSYSLLVVVLGTVYAGSVALLTTLLPGANTLVIAASTLAVAALFNPIRRRIQTAIDRRFFRGRYEAKTVVDELSSKLQGHLEVDELTTEVETVLTETLQPGAVGVWIRDR